MITLLGFWFGSCHLCVSKKDLKETLIYEDYENKWLQSLKAENKLTRKIIPGSFFVAVFVLGLDLKKDSVHTLPTSHNIMSHSITHIIAFSEIKYHYQQLYLQSDIYVNIYKRDK